VPPSDRFATAGSEGEEKGKAETAAVRAVKTTTRLERKCMLAVGAKIKICGGVQRAITAIKEKARRASQQQNARSPLWVFCGRKHVRFLSSVFEARDGSRAR
jgi:hypothetical protein